MTDKTKDKIGYLPESPYFYDYLTAEEFLGFYGRLGGVSQTDLHQRIPALLERVGLTEARCRPLRKFSKGMLQRIGLAQALIHDPELVILFAPDEIPAAFARLSPFEKEGGVDEDGERHRRHQYRERSGHPGGRQVERQAGEPLDRSGADEGHVVAQGRAHRGHEAFR